MGRVWMALCVLALLAPAVALAQEEPPPSDAPVVAGPLADGATLVAFDRFGLLCVGLRGGRDSLCDPPPESALRAYATTAYHGATPDVYGVATPDVASVEVLTTGAPVTVAAGAGAYAGSFAGRVRFFLARVPGRPYRVRFLDAQGRVVGATDLAMAPALAAPVTYGGGMVGGRKWRAVTFQRSALAQTPLDLGRTEATTCVDARFGGQETVTAGCAGRSAVPDDVAYFLEPHCAPAALSVAGLAGAGVDRIDALLGDGARRPVGLTPLPASFGDPRRAFALVVGGNVAVRSLLVSAGGRTRVVGLAAAPAAADCNSLGLAGATYGVALRPPPTGDGPLLARDDGDDLCVGLGAIVASDCRLPSPDLLRARIERRAAGANTAVLAVVPSAVASLRLRFDRGAPVAVPTVDLPGYAGRYAGLVRAAAVVVPGHRRLYDADLLAADGTVLDRQPGPDEPPLAHAPRVLQRLPGGVVVAADADCIQVRSGPPTRDPVDCGPGFDSGVVAAPCAARRIVVVAHLPSAHATLDVTTSRGTLRARRHGAFAVAVVPARVAVRAVRVTGGRRTAFPLPPAARQCGYATSPGLTTI